MAKAQKQTASVKREASSGRFIVAKPATDPKRFKVSQIRDAVRKVKKDQAASKQ